MEIASIFSRATVSNFNLFHLMSIEIGSTESMKGVTLSSTLGREVQGSVCPRVASVEASSMFAVFPGQENKKRRKVPLDLSPCLLSYLFSYTPLFG